MTKYSIIVVTKDNASGLNRTLNSVARLDYSAFELIIVDGDSHDNTNEVVSFYSSLINNYISEPDCGIYNAMNKGVSYASGDYIVFMNAGDCFSGRDILSFVSNFDSDIILGASEYGKTKRYPPKDVTLYSLLSEGICHQSTYYRASLLRKYPFDETLAVTADLKSVIEPFCKERVSIVSTNKTLSICEGGGISQSHWRVIFKEKELIIKDCVNSFYMEDYLKFSQISNRLVGDFAIISRFSSLSPVVKLISAFSIFINRVFKHIPF